jgi:hypothetical protein
MVHWRRHRDRRDRGRHHSAPIERIDDPDIPKEFAVTENSDPKQAGRFQKGQSGNPAGKPKGALNHATRAAQALLDGEAERVTRKVIERALEGDAAGLRLCLERICPPRRDRPLSLDLPEINSAADASGAMASVLSAVAAGEITPNEAQDVAALIDTFRRTIETQELEARIAALEKAEKTR